MSIEALNLSSYDFELKDISDNISSLNRYKNQKYYLEVLRIFSMTMLSKSKNKYPFYVNGNVRVRPSAELLVSFISFWIAEVNQHKTFLEFVEGVIHCFFHSIEKNNKLKGVKILVKGRIQGMDRSRKTWISVGTIPLHTISANVDYAQSSSVTRYGIIGLKVWLFYTNKTNTNVIPKTIKI